jgi:hypothetical protein
MLTCAAAGDGVCGVCGAPAQLLRAADDVAHERGDGQPRGPQFTCFTITKVQILTPEELLKFLSPLLRGRVLRLLEYVLTVEEVPPSLLVLLVKKYRN